MKQKRFRKIIFASLMLIVICIITLVSLNLNENIKATDNLENIEDTNLNEIEVLEDGTKVNRGANFEKTKKFGDYEISNIIFTSNNNITTITADVKNVTKVKVEEKIITLKLLDKQNKDIANLSGIVKILEPNEITKLKITATLNYIEAYDYILN